MGEEGKTVSIAVTMNDVARMKTVLFGNGNKGLVAEHHETAKAVNTIKVYVKIGTGIAAVVGGAIATAMVAMVFSGGKAADDADSFRAELKAIKEMVREK